MASTTPTVDQLATSDYLSGLNQNGTVAAVSYEDWNNDNPATYSASASSLHKWHNNPSGVTTGGFSAAGSAGGTVTYAFNPADNFTAAQEQAFIATLTLWSDESDITFSQVTNTTTADVLFSITSSGGTYESTTPSYTSASGSTNVPDELTPTVAQGGQASITFNDSGPYGTIGSFTAEGGYGVSALTHEVGHLLGLGHSGPYNDGSGTAGANQAPSLQENEYDSRQWSVMSYIEPSDTTAAYYNQYTVTGTDWNISTTVGGTTTTYQGAPETPMILDILAAQQLYGKPTSTALSGGQVFGFNCNIADASKPFFDFTQNTSPIITLWDAGSNNTLDLSGWSNGATVNLNPGNFSSAGGLTNNIGIAFGTAIDRLVGTTGDDVITVNSDADIINGDGGSDTVAFSGARAAYTIAGAPAALTVTQISTGVVDTLTAIATLTFSDGSVATSAVACYCAGTRIATVAGEVAVEALAIGDVLLTASGERRAVRWIGHRTYGARFIGRNPALYPVCFRAGSLGAGLPWRDLLVSPDHAMFIDGLLIAARLLVDGRTIVREAPQDAVTYFHVELDRHEVILAEGAPSESFVDDDSRGMFHNAPDYAALYPVSAVPAVFCAPRVEGGYALEQARRRLADAAIPRRLAG